MNSLETQIDELYARPLAEFTASRNALARTLKGDDASRVKRLPKPTAVPWSVNQLYWQRRDLYEQLMAAGRALHAAQVAALEGKAADVRAATAAHRTALQSAVAAATALAGNAGVNPPADPLARMLEAISLAATHPPEPGRITDLIQPAGFEALAGIAPVLPRHAPTPATDPPAPVRKTKRSEAEERRHRDAVAAQARKSADTAVDHARRQLSEAQTTEARVAAQVELARQQLKRAEASLQQSQALVSAATELVERAETARRRL